MTSNTSAGSLSAIASGYVPMHRVSQLLLLIHKVHEAAAEGQDPARQAARHLLLSGLCRILGADRAIWGTWERFQETKEAFAQRGLQSVFVLKISFYNEAAAEGIFLFRKGDSGPASEEDAAFFGLVLSHLRWVVGPLLERPSAFEGLSERKRQTLEGLLLGQSEKQIAADLGLSPHTIHEYVVYLYRHFQVQSRGELLAKVHREYKLKEGRSPSCSVHHPSHPATH